MKLYLFLKDYIKIFMLPEMISGSYNFDEDNDSEDKLINIDAKDGKWVFYSTEESKILYNNQIVEELPIIPNSYYTIKKNNIVYIIYTEKLIEDTFKAYTYDNSIDIIAGNNNNCSILYKNNYENGELFQIYYDNNGLVLDKITKNRLYLNNKAIEKTQIFLNYGDTINYYGFKIIIMKDKLLINNPNNMILVNEALSKLHHVELPRQDKFESIDTKEVDLYESKDYFSKSPRVRRVIETKEIELTSPPHLDSSSKQSLLLTMGPMLAMALTSMITLTNVGTGLVSGERDLSTTWPQLASSLVMILSAIVWPIVARKIEAKMAKARKKELIKKYNYYLNDKRKELEQERRNQKEILCENLITVEECMLIIKLKSVTLWDKRLDQSDFSVVRFGMGNEKLDVEINYPKEGFSIDQSELKEAVSKMQKEYEYIENVPIGYSLAESKITAIMGNIEKGYYFIYNILVQLFAFYSYEDLKIVILTNEQNEDKWDFMKYSLHSFTNEKTIRFFSSTLESIQLIMDYLYQELMIRRQTKTDVPKPHYLIITDDYHRIKNQEFIKELTEIKDDENVGMSMLILEKRINDLPSKCCHFVNVADEKSEILKNSYEKQEHIYFKDEINYTINMMDLIRTLSNIPIEFTEGGEAALPETLTFLEMEKVGKVEQLNIISRWNSNSPTETLKAELGVGDNGEMMYLDLHEKAHGPHGLIAGMTGSGKSEFIITYLLSMAINYSPDDVAFILIDYKGGGLAFAFENKLTGVSLPHLAGTITNLDKSEMDRTLVSIDSESKRRQKIFNETRDRLGESTIDIYKYQRFYREGKVTEPIPHLLIVCDEFAELKSQQPDFMDNLISIARIGRSLGIHLILATQKPSGVVNDQIWSNSKFHICLKVQDTTDSQEMLKKPDAANLKQAGRFYLQVGYDEYFALGQSAWCGAKYFPSEKIVKEVDKSVNLLADNGIIIKKIQASNGQKKIEAQGEQLAAIMNEIIKAANQVNKHTKRLWLENIPPIITIDSLIKKYNFKYSKDGINFIVGEFDAPEQQQQNILVHNILEKGNTKILSNESSETEFFVKMMMYQLLNNYSSEQLNFYVIDYGGQTLRVFEKTPHCGGYVIQGDDEKYKSLIKLIKEEIERRKKILADYNGDYNNYLEKGKKDMPISLIIINNFEALKDAGYELVDSLSEILRDSERYGMVYFMTGAAQSSIPLKLAITFSTGYAFKLKELYDYQDALGVKAKSEPRDIQGRGYFVDNDVLHEFQTASIVNEGEDETPIIEKAVNVIVENNKTKALNIPELPDQVTMDYVESKIKKFKNVPIGIRKDNVEVARYDFTNTIGTVVCANKLSYTKSFIMSLIQVFRKINNTKIIVLDTDGSLESICKGNKNYYRENLGDVLGGVANFFSEEQKENVVVILYGFAKIKDSLIDPQTLNILTRNMKNQNKNVSLIIVDTPNKIKESSFEEWYKTSFSEKDGIFIGTGASDQNVIKITNFDKMLSLEYKTNFGFQINEGMYKLVKLIEFQIVNEEEEDE